MRSPEPEKPSMKYFVATVLGGISILGFSITDGCNPPEYRPSTTPTPKPTATISSSAISDREKLMAVQTAIAIEGLSGFPVSAEDLLQPRTPTQTPTS